MLKLEDLVKRTQVVGIDPAGPVAIVSLNGLRRTGLIQPGSLYSSKYRIRLDPRYDAAAVRKDWEKARAGEGWTFKDRLTAAPGYADLLLGEQTRRRARALAETMGLALEI